MPGKKRAQKKVDQEEELDYKTQIKKLQKKIDDLEKVRAPRKLSALNKFKKSVLGKITEQALIEADFHDLIAIDKIRLLNRAYPIIWDNLVLEPLYARHNCQTPEEQNALKKSKEIQIEYNEIVDGLINQMHSGEKDDQQHFMQDIQEMFVEAIRVAAETFDKNDDDE